MRKDPPVIRDFTEYLRRRSSPYTVQSYVSMVRRFLSQRGDPIDFINSLPSKPQQLLAFSALKKFYRFRRMDLGIERDDLDFVKWEHRRPALTDEEVRKLIEYAKRGGVLLRSLTAMSTIYGLRRGEMKEARVENGFLLVKALKGGELRKHRVPEALLPYITPVRASLSTISFTYIQVSKKLGIWKERSGWHSVRRWLDSKLLELGVPVFYVKRFLGWKLGSMEIAFGMPGYYGAALKQEDVDKVVLQVHPALRWWTE